MSVAATTIRTRGRARAEVLFSRAGNRFAELDARPMPHRIILLFVPQAMKVMFDPTQAVALDCVIELRVTDPAGGAPTPFTITINGGACKIKRGAAPHPGAGATLRADDMVRLASGAVGWPELLAANRLGLFGDVFLAVRIPRLFRLPAQAVS
jgi:hypothetical protein